MGQAPRTLDGSASARHFFGAELRRLRENAGLSLPTLGRLVRFSADLVRRVETAERFPSRELAEACDRALETGGILTRLWPLLDQERSRGASGPDGSAGPVAAEYRVEAGPTPTWASSDATRRVPVLPAVMDRAALEWLLDLAPVTNLSSTNTSAPWVDDGDVAGAAAALRMFRELDHAHGAGQVHEGVRRYLTGDLHRMLRGRSVDDEVATQLSTVAAGFSELSGYQAVDMGADGMAQRWYLRALRSSAAAGDRLYGGYLLGVSVAHLALHTNQPELALRLVQAALHGTTECATPAVQAALRAVLARAHARLGHEQECTSALSAAERSLGRSRPGNEPLWIAYFSPTYLADEMAHCFFDLGQQALAQRYVAEALCGLRTSHLRRLAIDSALLASSLAAAGEVEQACAVGRRAVAHAAATDSLRCIQRVAAMRVEMEPHSSEPDVRDLTDYLRSALPAAA